LTLKPEDNEAYPEQHFHGLTAPKGEKDWREKGNEIKDQGQCGSCWAFAATATLEYLASLRVGKKTDLAEQELVDCATSAAGY
jgi:cathepsin L